MAHMKGRFVISVGVLGRAHAKGDKDTNGTIGTITPQGSVFVPDATAYRFQGGTACQSNGSIPSAVI
jgi:hypothetical protein